VVLLPYIEQTALYDAIRNNTRDDGDAGANLPTPLVDYPFPFPAYYYSGSTAINPHTVYRTTITSYICPSSGAPPRTNSAPGSLSYRISRGDIQFYGWDYPETRAFGDSGSLIHHTDANSNGGAVSVSAITDGLSNTIAFSEAVYAVKNPRRAKGGFAKAPFNGYSQPPANLLLRRDGNGNLTGTIEEQFVSGMAWMDGTPNLCVFNTILPPNSPSGGPNVWNEALLSASSNHTNGVNCLFADGSTHFITESIQTGSLNQLPSVTYGHGTQAVQFYKGPSIYGVWGALGSANGGEQSTIP
jgi:prepilin-type processing-associated H-X9-DG protein